jgi:hypothetical protein
LSEWKGSKGSPTINITRNLNELYATYIATLAGGDEDDDAANVPAMGARKQRRSRGQANEQYTARYIRQLSKNSGLTDLCDKFIKIWDDMSWSPEGRKECFSKFFNAVAKISGAVGVGFR